MGSHRAEGHGGRGRGTRGAVGPDIVARASGCGRVQGVVGEAEEDGRGLAGLDRVLGGLDDFEELFGRDPAAVLEEVEVLLVVEGARHSQTA